MIIKERLKQLRKLMKQHHMDVYIVPTSDFHETEYVGEYFKARQFLSGFSGSNGTLVVTAQKAGLWTDGRYFIQAKEQLAGSGIDLMKMGEPDTPDLLDYAVTECEENGIVGFDGRVMNAKTVLELKQKLESKQGKIAVKYDLVDFIWEERPALPMAKAFLLDEKYCGQGVKEKLASIRERLVKENADAILLNTLDDIAWTFNLRGFDVKNFPVVLAYAYISLHKAYLYVEEKKLTTEMKDHFTACGVTVRPYEQVYEDLPEYSEGRMLMDLGKINYALYNAVTNQAGIIDQPNCTQMMKAVKNETEIEQTIEAHVKDGVAFTKFMYWLKTNVGKMEMTELSVQQYLENKRREQDGFIEPSFDTICAYKEHAAMMHYSATIASNASLQAEGLLLVDSGGQYLQGTTDITRTMALGTISEQQRHHFTAVLKSVIHLSKAVFLKGCRGMNLDILARGPIWEMGIDYRCGTGHGVGHVLGVHEGPNGFRWKIVPERNDSCILEEGMITTNEPGIYIEGSHGIRIENEMVVRFKEQNEYGTFLRFGTLTVAPIDLDAIDADMLNQSEKAWLNAYHRYVFETLSPYLYQDEIDWLKHYTRALS